MIEQNQNIRKIIEPLVGKQAWYIYLGDDNLLNLDFVQVPTVGEKINTDYSWHLWVSGSVWRIETATEPLVSFEDDKNTIVSILEQLEDSQLLTIEVSYPAYEAVLTFSEGRILKLFPVTTEKHLHWALFTPDEHVLKVGPGGNWSYTEKSTP